MGIREGYFDAGMTKREHAAITLRAPNSGDEQLDAMIRQSNRRDAAVAAMQGLLGSPDYPHGFEALADDAVRQADALLARLEESNNG
jgi:hypothetical protein